MVRRSLSKKATVLAAAGLVAGLCAALVAPNAASGTTHRATAEKTRPHGTYVSNPSGYWMAGADGGVFAFTTSAYKGSVAGTHLNKPIVGIAATPSGNGYWLVGGDGGVFAFGDAGFFGSLASVHLNAPIVGIAATPDGQGYWLVAADGGVFAFGDATFNGSMAGTSLSAPIVGIASTPTGNGYWLVASDGGVFAFGDATFHGSMAGIHLGGAIVGIAATPTGNGYWLAGADGGVDAFGDAAFYGSEGAAHLAAPISAIGVTPGGMGYWLVGTDGAVYGFANATNLGSMAGTALGGPIVGLAPLGRTVGGQVLRVGTLNGIAGQYSTIQAAVNAAQPGDWILVAPGDYHETDDISNPPSQSAINSGWYGGVDISTPYIHLRGMNRNSVIVDGTNADAPTCSGSAGDQNLGVDGTNGPIGRNGIVVWKADGVSVQNLTVCNFLTGHGNAGNEIWWNGGAESGTVGLTGYSGSYLTATSSFDGTINSTSASGNYGIFSSDAAGPGTWNTVYANNFTDSGMYIGACRQLCDAWVNNAVMEHNALGYSGTNSGGTIVIENSRFDDNIDGLDTNTQSAGDPPPPQNGQCLNGGVSGITHTKSCWVFMHNDVFNNNDADAPGYGGLAQPVGTGMTVSGATNDTFMDNTFAGNGAWGILFVPYPDTNPGPPGVCQASGGHLETSLGLGCVYDPKGDALLNNSFYNNGYYGNPSNSDFGQITFFSQEESNCYAGNVYPDGSAPSNLEQVQPTCDVNTTASNIGGPLFDQVLCDTGFASLLGVSCTGDHYPTPSAAAPTIKPVPTNLPTMPNPCAGVPANPWCANGMPVAAPRAEKESVARTSGSAVRGVNGSALHIVALLAAAVATEQRRLFV